MPIRWNVVFRDLLCVPSGMKVDVAELRLRDMQLTRFIAEASGATSDLTRPNKRQTAPDIQDN